MKKHKSIIDTYETLYQIDIVVANKYSTVEELKKKYKYSNDTPLDDFITTGICTTSVVNRLSDNKTCILIKYNHDTKIKSLDPVLDFINTVCHESGHVTLEIYRAIGQDVCPCSQEPFCYLLGFAAECIYKTLKKKC